jgi:ABC-2 type transport system permease protein
MSRKILAIIKREYWSRAKTKGFIIGTLIFPLFLVLIFGGIFIIQKVFQPSTRNYYVVDQTDMIYDKFASIMTDTLKNGEPKFVFHKETIANDDLDATMENLQKMVRNEQISGYLVIPSDVIESREIKYSAASVSDFEEQGELRWGLSRVISNIRLEQKGFNPDSIRHEMWLGNVKLVSSQVTDKGEVEKSGASSFILTYILAYVMFLMIMIYGTMIMRSVIEEKSQRITEMIVSAISPFELMLGKIIGICALGITQLVIFGLMLFFIVKYGEPIVVGLGATDTGFIDVIKNINFTFPILLFFIFFFIVGFMLFSAVYAAIGAMVNTEDEGQQLMPPIIILLLVSYFVMFATVKNPATPMAFWASLFPFFTPLVMFGRIAVSDPVMPSGAYLSIFTLIFFTFLFIWLAGKIYRIGILMYGKKVSIKEAIKWIKYK